MDCAGKAGARTALTPRASPGLASRWRGSLAPGGGEGWGEGRRWTGARSSGPSVPDHQQNHSERHRVHVVLGQPGLDASQLVAEPERPRGEEVHDAVNDVAVDPADEPREPEDDAAVDAGEQIVQPEAPERRVADDAERAGERLRIDRAALVREPREE